MRCESQSCPSRKGVGDIHRLQANNAAGHETFFLFSEVGPVGLQLENVLLAVGLCNCITLKGVKHFKKEPKVCTAETGLSRDSHTSPCPLANQVSKCFSSVALI